MLHDEMKTKSPTATIPGAIIGTAMSSSIRMREHPSMSAASSMLAGFAMMKFLSIQTAKGIEKIALTSTTADSRL